MDDQLQFESLRQDYHSWWSVARRKLLQEILGQALRGKRRPRVLDYGCAAGLTEGQAGVGIWSAHWSLPMLAFHQMEGFQGLVCSAAEELAFASNTFDAIACGDVLQMVQDDTVVLREMRRILKDGGLLCLTVPAHMFLWGEEDEARGHQRRYSASELRRKLNNCGFEIHRVSYFVASGFGIGLAGRFGRDIFRKFVRHGKAEVQTSKPATLAIGAALEVERHLMHYINLPFGTRLVCWARKPALVAERVTVPAWERQWARQPLPLGSNYSAHPEVPGTS